MSTIKDGDKSFNDAIKLELDGDYDSAFNAYLSTAHLYLSIRKQATLQSDISSTFYLVYTSYIVTLYSN